MPNCDRGAALVLAADPPQPRSERQGKKIDVGTCFEATPDWIEQHV